MSLIKWEPFGDLDRFFEDFTRFPREFGGGDLAVDVYEEDGNVIAKMNLPGIEPEQVDVSVQNGYLRVSGTREEEKEEEKKNYYSKEIRRGSFERTVRLPSPVDEGKVEAEYEKGTLKVTMPKTKAEKKGKVKVKVKGK